MAPSRALAILACAAVVFLGVVLWRADSAAPRAPELASPPLPQTPEPASPELSRGDDPAIDADRAAASERAPADDIGAAGATPPAAVPSGRVHGRVIDQDDVTVAAATLILRRGHADTAGSSDAGGRYAFEGLRSGVYRLDVDSRSLPDGLLPPWRQQVAREYAAPPTGILGTMFRLNDGDELEVDVRVFEGASVRGRVVGPDRLPVSDALVSIRSTSGISHTAGTDAQGAFDFARVYPVAYTTNVALASDGILSLASAPLPLHFALAPGEARTLADLVAGVGGHVLRGSVVDERGQPVVGIEVVCEEDPGVGRASRWESHTDAAGHYELGRVPGGMLVVSVESTSGAETPQGARILRGVGPIRIDTRGAPEIVDLDTIAVQLTHAFRLVGRIHLDPTWARQNDAERSTIRVDVRDLGERVSRAADWLMSDVPLDAGATREFTWSCATPRATVELHVELRTASGVDHARKTVVHPAPDATEQVLVEFR